ncbi:hypothetical protein [Saccharopolyspora phatthalungensis]|uniref:Na+/H+-dicarboxylate symporter n=1 Tax=Saccharopolyspora phatthalungensis TaxID=664693 RepID=A0A840QAD6_9PSEU|nr:hypothetical protein [Saccharopolyspora phatthalungensis]MBB5157744.1 Na+/H+-dicarboxylate symporter [Saccharopolyspora phatthalungensis]
MSTLASLGAFIGLYWATAAAFVVVVLGAVLRLVGLTIFKLLRYIKEENPQRLRHVLVRGSQHPL